MKWQEKGIGAPEEVVTATEEYRLEEDFLATFLADKCIAELKAVAYAGMLFQVYEQWCEDNGEEPVPQKLFGSELRSRNFVSEKKRGQRAWFGLRLRTAELKTMKITQTTRPICPMRPLGIEVKEGVTAQ